MRISDWSSDVCSSDLVALTDRSAPCNAALQFGLFDQIAILMRQHVALHLSDRIDGHVDDDEQAGAAELKRQTGPGDEIFGYDADQSQIGRPDHRGAREHEIKIGGGVLARTNTGNEHGRAIRTEENTL